MSRFFKVSMGAMLGYLMSIPSVFCADPVERHQRHGAAPGGPSVRPLDSDDEHSVPGRVEDERKEGSQEALEPHLRHTQEALRRYIRDEKAKMVPHLVRDIFDLEKMLNEVFKHVFGKRYGRYYLFFSLYNTSNEGSAIRNKMINSGVEAGEQDAERDASAAFHTMENTVRLVPDVHRRTKDLYTHYWKSISRSGDTPEHLALIASDAFRAPKVEELATVESIFTAIEESLETIDQPWKRAWLEYRSRVP